MPASRRGRQAAGADETQMERLATALGVALRAGDRRDKFKAPKFDGSGDVELFIAQFQDVSRANCWSGGDALLHMRANLEKDATVCGRGENLCSILLNLRARFGLTVRQARDRLMGLKREPNQSLHALAVEIHRLVNLGYPPMAAADRESIAIDTFKRAVDNKALARHLLAIQCEALDDVVTAAEEYFQVAGAQPPRARPMMAALGREEPPAAGNDTATGNSMDHKLIERLVTALELNSKVLAQFSPSAQTPFTSRQPRKDQPLGCHKCGAMDHWKRNCPQSQQPGNGGSSQ